MKRPTPRPRPLMVSLILTILGILCVLYYLTRQSNMAILESSYGRQCVYLTVEEKNAFLALGWVLHGGPYETSEQCLAECFPVSTGTSTSPPPGTGSDYITTVCCSDYLIPAVLTGNFNMLQSSASGIDFPVTDLGVVMPQTVSLTYSLTGLSPSSTGIAGWRGIVTGDGGLQYEILMYCNVSGFPILFSGIPPAGTGLNQGGATYSCDPFISTNTSPTSNYVISES